jgi:hypothetical protein
MTESIRRAVALGILILALATDGAAAAETLKTGAAFREQLATRIGITWVNNPLREALAKLSDSTGIAIVLDRRVDPDQPIEFTVANEPLEDALRRLASRLNLGVSIFDSTVYLGPTETTARLATLAALEHDKLAQMPRAAQARFGSLPPLDAAALSTPRELLTAWAEQVGLELRGVEHVPHDLWPELHLPAQSSVSRAMLLLAGFDLALELAPDGSAMRIIPAPQEAVLTREYPGGGKAASNAQKLAEHFPAAHIETRNGKLHVAASWEVHDQIGRLLRGEKITRTEVVAGEQRYTLNVENQPLGAVAKAVGQRVGREIEFDPSLSKKLEARISFKTNEATLEELFQQMLDPVGLTCEINEQRIKIRAK